MNNFWQNRKADIYIRLYDDLAKSLKTGQELTFLKDQFSKKQSIIEFGCGTGRTLIPLLEAGYRVSGLDFSAGMLEVLRKKLNSKKLLAPVFHKNLLSFSFTKKYDGGILSQRALNFISTQDGQRKALINIARVLKKGATLVINLMPGRPDDFAKKQVKLKKTERFINSETGNMVELWENWIPNPMEQTWKLTNRFVERGKSLTTRMTMRVIFEPEMKNLLALCGFRVLRIFGDWKGGKYNEKSSDFIVVAGKV